MASRLLTLVTWLLLSLSIAALQVTPNSPCASLCVDSSELDLSDPRSSNTKNSDIVCEDRLYSTKQTGQKWKSCITCLQNSTYSQGAETDQAWFICG
jgi:hypothetical protein